jgi:cytochrome P450
VALGTTRDVEPLLNSDEFLRDPYPVLRTLQDSEPVYWSESIGGWLLTRYDDVLLAFKDTARFSNEGRIAKAVEYLPADTRATLKPFEDHYRSRGLLNSDPPDHTRLRSLVSGRFTPRAVEAWRPRIEEIVANLLDGVQKSGEMDAIRDLATPLPATVVADLFGVPSEDKSEFVSWADDVLSFQGVNRPSVATLLRAQHGLVSIREYVRGLLDVRRRDPGEDLLSALVAADEGGERLTQAELLNTSVTFLVAGHETTRSLIGNGLYLLLSRPERWQELREQPELIKPAIEETLRFESPIGRVPRLVKEDVELRGKQIRQGDVVFQMVNAANRDPELFSKPDELDIRRTDNRHMAFGNGIHFCLGAPFARLEGAIAFAAIIERMPAIKLIDPQPDWELEKQNSRMLRSLPVSF